MHIEEMHSVPNTKKKRERRGKGEKGGGGAYASISN